MQPAVSILPDGTVEFVDASLLDGVPRADMSFFVVCSHAEGAVIPNADFLAAMGQPRSITLTPYREGEDVVTRFTWPEVSRDMDAQMRYEVMREKGESHRLAEVLATRAFPSFKTDSTFNKGRVCGNQFEDCPGRGDWLAARAAEAGVSTTGKYYMSGLARFPGDPKAWVSDRNDVLRVARENNMTVEGDVNYKAPESAPVEDVAVAPEILRREVDAYLAQNPDARQGDAEEAVREVITGQVDKHEPLVEA